MSIELINFLLSDVSQLQEEIERLLGQQQSEKAIQYMNRAVYLLENNEQLSNVGDFLKWIGYTYFENAKHDLAILNYKRAAEDYQAAADYSNLGATLTDLASVYEASDLRF